MPNNHIFHSLLSHLSTQIFGESEIAFRLPAFLAGILAIGFIYWWVFEIYNSKSVAFLASCFLALSPTHILFSQTARGYSLIILFALLAQLSLYKFLEKSTIKWLVVFIFCNILNILTVPSSSFFVGSLLISLTATHLICKSYPKKLAQEAYPYVEKVSLKKVTLLFFVIFVPTAIFYFPLLTDMSSNASLYRAKSFFSVLDKLIKDFFLPGFPLIIFLIFVFGAFALCVKKLFWGILLLFSFLLPFMSFMIKLGGPARVYMFCLPFFIFAFTIGFYEIVKKILAFFANKLKISSVPNAVVVLLILIPFSISSFIFLEKNHYSKYNSYKFKNLRTFTNQFEQKNNLIFRPIAMQYDYYLNDLLSRNSIGLLSEESINNIYLLTGRTNKSLEKYYLHLNSKKVELIKEFKDSQLEAKFESEIYSREADAIKLYQLHPTRITEILDSTFFKTNWIQSLGNQKIDITYNTDSGFIEVDFPENNNSPSSEFSFVNANTFYRLKMKDKGFLFVTYALNYPKISVKYTSEPLIVAIVAKDKKNKTINELPQHFKDLSNSYSFLSEGRLWYVKQKIVLLNKGDYDFTLGFWVQGLEKSGINQPEYLISNLHVYLIEF